MQVQSNMSIESAVVAMETGFPDAPDDVLMETSAHENQREVRGHMIHVNIGWLCTGSGIIF